MAIKSLTRIFPLSPLKWGRPFKSSEGKKKVSGFNDRMLMLIDSRLLNRPLKEPTPRVLPLV